MELNYLNNCANFKSIVDLTFKKSPLQKKKILNSTNLILHGVGAFGNAIQKLEEYNLREEFNKV